MDHALKRVGPLGADPIMQRIQALHDAQLPLTPEAPKDLQKIVCVGGGTGSPMVVEGLLHFPVYPISITTMFDSGGNSGELRDVHGILPPGDFRRAVLAHSGDDESSLELRKLFRYRYSKDEASPLSGHVGGNLIFLMCEIAFGREEAVRIFPKLFKIRGEVLPVSLTDATLCLQYSDGTVVRGEGNIAHQKLGRNVYVVKAWLEPRLPTATVVPYSRALQSLGEAGAIVLGPGSLFSSVIPNMIVPNFVDAINVAEQAKLVFVVNLMNEPAETRGYTVADFVDVLYRHGLKRPIDALLVNEGGISPQLARKYQRKGSAKVRLTLSAEKRLKGRVRDIVLEDLVSEEGFSENLIRHDPLKVAAQIVSLLPPEERMRA